MVNELRTLFQDIADAIKYKTGSTDTMKPAEFPAKIAAIPAGGGGSAAGAVTVTFCNYDGTEIYSRQVFIGDDCPDPVAQRKIDAPTKESTAQYKYTHNGWSTTAGGAADANALKNIEANKTVYASFAATVREYTVRFLDGDTVMKTEQVAFGMEATPPDTTKAGFAFVGWTPSSFVITADTDFIGEWQEAGWAEKILQGTANTEIGTANSYAGTVLFSPDGTNLFVNSGSYLLAKKVVGDSLVGWVLKTGFDRHTYYAHSPTENLFVSGFENATASTQKSKFMRKYRYTDTDITVESLNGNWEDGVARISYHMAFSPDGNTLYALSNDSKLFVFNTTTWEYTTYPLAYQARRLAVSPDGKRIVCGGVITSDRAPMMLDVENGFSEIAVEFQPAKIGSYIRICYSPDGRYVAHNGENNDAYRIVVYDVTTTPATQVASFGADQGFSTSISDLQFTHDGRKLVALQVDKTLSAIDTATWKELPRPAFEMPSGGSSVRPNISINASDSLVAVGSKVETKWYLYKIQD